jgi:ubiquinone/menaquinone biosynthesis C-methylase UbiE
LGILAPAAIAPASQRVDVSYYSPRVQRDWETARLDIPASLPATEQMSPGLDPLSLRFAIHMRNASHFGLDVGCGTGVATTAAMARGGRMVAVDPDRKALQRLISSIPREQHPRLKVKQAMLEDLDFEFAHFSAVHASRVLHLMTPGAVKVAFGKFFRWLYPEGKLFISVLTSFPRGAEREGVHLLEESTLRRELEAVGFIIEDMSSGPLAWDFSQVCCSVVARCVAEPAT